MDRRSGKQETGAACTVDDFWLPTNAGSLGAAWFWPTGPIDAEAIGVVIVPSIIHEEQTMAVGLVALACDLAERGMPALMVDLTGTAQGADTLAAPDLGSRWDDDIRSAVRCMRSAGLRHVAVVGVRLGAMLAAHALVGEPVDVLAMWAPALSGRHYVRELQVMQATADDVDREPLPGITVAGFHLPSDVVDHLKRLDAAKLDGKPAGRLILIDSAQRLDALDDDHPMFAGVPVERLVAPRTEHWLFTAADTFPVPFEDLPQVVQRVEAAGRAASTTPESSMPDLLPEPTRPDVSDARTRVIRHDDVEIRETFVEFGSSVFPDGGRLTGVLSEPMTPADPSKAYVAVTTAGPGRIFVELARREATLGRACLRVNLSGFGTSSRYRGVGWADFYAPSAAGEIDAAIDLLDGRGFRHVHVVGFCAGAWAALRMSNRPELAGIIGINPQLMIRSRLSHRRMWPGLSTRNHLLAVLGTHRQAERVIEGIANRVPWPSPVMRDIGRHVAAGTEVTMIFDDRETGYDYFTKMAQRPFGIRSVQRRPNVRPYSGLGHLASGRARQQMFADLHDHTSSAASPAG